MSMSSILTSSTDFVALITGGARRVGRAICLALHREGYRLIIHCNNSMQDAQQLQLHLNSIREKSAAVIQADLSKDAAETAEELVEKSVAVWGRLDLVVNNASNFISSTLDEVTSDEWDLSLNVNLKCPVFIMKTASKYLKKVKGSIVNLSDLIGMKPKDTHFAHSISKAGLIMATQNAALNLAPEVRVNAIFPCCVMWPEIDPSLHSEEEKQKWLSKTPLNKIGTPEDVAGAVVFLASQSANFITGQVLKLDGGRSLVF